jgi:transcription initiation factor IIE alpha subunit
MMANDQAKNLNDRQYFLLIWIIKQIVANRVLKMSNDEIAAAVGIPKSTIEKYLKKLDELDLIIRTNEREYNDGFHRWETVDREIKLNPIYFDQKILAGMTALWTKDAIESISTPEFLLTWTDLIRSRQPKSAT